MKKKLSFISIAGITAVIVGLMGGVLPQANAAGSASLTLSPASGSHAQGANMSVAIKVSSSDQINVAEGDLTYDSAKLQFVSVDESASSFNFPLAVSGGGGSVSVARGVSAGGTLTGNLTLATVNFKVLAGSGTTSVSFASSSMVVRPSDSQNVWNGSPTGGTYTLTTPVVTPPPTTGGGGTTTGGGSTTGGAQSGSTGSTSGSTPTSSTKSTSPVTTPTAAQQKSNPSQPVPVSAAGVAGETGFMVAIRVVDNNGKPISGAEVTMVSKTVKSDKTGIASFTGIPAGTHDVLIKTSGGEVRGAVSVSGDIVPATAQAFTLQAKPQSKLISYLLIGVGSALLLGAILFIIIRFWPKGPLFATVGTPVGMAGGGSGIVVSGSGSGPAQDETMARLDRINVEKPQPDSVIHPTDGDPGTVG